jgi:Ca-activated chloride channel family protein
MLFRLLLITASLFATAPAFAQSVAAVPSLPPEDSHLTFRSSVDLVTLNVSVTDGQDRHVAGLAQNDFQVLEDGVPQALTFFAANQVPLDVALLIDVSSSMQDKIALVQQAADRFLRTLRAGDRGEIVAFNSQTKILQPFTSDAPKLRAAVKQTIARGGTALYTALYITLDQFMKAKAVSADVRRPAIIVLTDGQDTASLIQFDDVLERARRAGVAIFAISVISPIEAAAAEGDGGRRFLGDPEYSLKTLAKETGGRAFFPMQLSELDGVYGSVAAELSAQYALGYVPQSRAADGAFHKVLVRVISRPDAKPRTRTGYYSPRAAASLQQPASR